MNGNGCDIPVVDLESAHDHVTICRRMVGYDFPWEFNRALELAVLRTFCVPRISRLLRQSGEFVARPQKRYDDTSLILGNIMKWGYDSEPGRAAIAQMNRIHRRYHIHNEDFLYVLSVLVFEPVRWNQRYGWRPFTPLEKQALFQFWQTVGQRMKIADIPDTYAAFEQFNQFYEATYFSHSDDNQAVGDAVVGLMQSWVPAVVAPAVPVFVRALVDAPLREALGWPAPAPLTQGLVSRCMRWSRQTVRRLPRRRRPAFIVDAYNTTYPQGYEIAHLGSFAADSHPSTSRCPFLRLQSLLGLRVNNS